jgi:hypothetical protein
MMTRPFRRKPILFLLIAVLATPAAFAAGPRADESARPAQVRQPAGFDLLSQLWNSLRSLWSEEGCNIDPDGRCAPALAPQPPASIKTDEGCGIDPDGRCLSGPATQSDTGCHIDPNGRCRS